MSYHLRIVGIREKDDKFMLMKDIHDKCAAAQIAIPSEIEMFFDGEEPSEYGVRIELGKRDGISTLSVEGKEGVYLDLSALPKHITHLEIYNSY